MKKIAPIALALALAGCAELPKPELQPAAPAKHQAVKKASAAKPAAAPVSPAATGAENKKPATFMQRWFDKFKKHPK